MKHEMDRIFQSTTDGKMTEQQMAAKVLVLEAKFAELESDVTTSTSKLMGTLDSLGASSAAATNMAQTTAGQLSQLQHQYAENEKHQQLQWQQLWAQQQQQQGQQQQRQQQQEAVPASATAPGGGPCPTTVPQPAMPSAPQGVPYWEQPRRPTTGPATAAAPQYPCANCPATSPTAPHPAAPASASQYPHGNGPSHGRPVAFGAEFGASFSPGDSQPQQPSQYAPRPVRFGMTANDGRTYFDHKVAQQPANMYDEKIKERWMDTTRN